MQVKGIKGASILIVHPPPFDMVKGVAVDSLHVFFLGVVQDLLKYWFDKHYRTSSFSIYSKVKYSYCYDLYYYGPFLIHCIYSSNSVTGDY